MTLAECPREQDLLDAIDARRWPDRCHHELREHVATCPLCSDLAAVVTAVGDEHDRLWRQAALPPASLVWWRAEMRARTEAARVASRPVLVAQVASAFVVAAVALVWLAAAPAAGWLALALDAGRAWLATTAGSWSSVVPAGGSLVLWLVGGTWLLLLPAAVYFAVRE